MQYIQNEYGEEYHSLNEYTSRSKNAQEAHEAIRPVHINDKHLDMEEPYKKVYHLIWKRTIASQMAACQKKLITVHLDLDDPDIRIPMEAPQKQRFLRLRYYMINKNKLMRRIIIFIH